MIIISYLWILNFTSVCTHKKFMLRIVNLREIAWSAKNKIKMNGLRRTHKVDIGLKTVRINVLCVLQKLFILMFFFVLWVISRRFTMRNKNFLWVQTRASFGGIFVHRLDEKSISVKKVKIKRALKWRNQSFWLIS